MTFVRCKLTFWSCFCSVVPIDRRAFNEMSRQTNVLLWWIRGLPMNFGQTLSLLLWEGVNLNYQTLIIQSELLAVVHCRRCVGCRLHLSGREAYVFSAVFPKVFFSPFSVELNFYEPRKVDLTCLYCVGVRLVTEQRLVEILLEDFPSALICNEWWLAL